MANLVVSAVSTYDNKGLKKASKEISAFEKNLKSLTKTFGIAFGATALVSYGKKSVDAFMKDEAAAKSLEQQLKNTGYAFSSPDVEYYIANLQKMTGILDDQLRPAFQTLLTASGSLTKSQQALALALDISAATGKSVEEVSMALAKGFSGQTTALSRLGAGIDKATLATGDMDTIMGELQNKFSGQSKARLETYAGKMDLLKVSAANVSETLGKGLLDALSQIGKDKNIGKLGTAFEKIATVIANVIVALGAIIGKIVSIGQAIFEKLHLDKIIGFLFNNSLIGLLSKFGASQTDKPASNFTYGLGANAGVELAKIQELKARKALVTQLKAEADLKKLQDKYNLERIGLMAALNAATDDETKQRLSEKLAILDGNAARVGEYLAARNADQALVELATSTDDAKKALDKLKDWDPLSGLKVTAQDIKNTMGSGSSSVGGGGGASSNQTPIYPPATTSYDPLSSLQVSAADIVSAGISYNPLSGMAPTRQDIYNVYNTVEGSILSQQELDVIFQNSLLQLKRNGASLNYAGF
jgi:hypothetical protein